jgi:hypothetical protein
MTTTKMPDPCTLQKTEDTLALKRERDASNAHEAAWKRFNSEAIRKMVSVTDFTAARLKRLVTGRRNYSASSSTHTKPSLHAMHKLYTTLGLR